MGVPYRFKVTWANGSMETIESEERPCCLRTGEGRPVVFLFPDGSTVNMPQVRRWTLLGTDGMPVPYDEQ